MLLVVVVLCWLLTLGRTGGLAAPTILLGVILFALQVIDLEIPSSALALASEGAAGLFLVLLCTVLLIGLFGPGRITVNRIIGAVVVYLLIGLLFSLLLDLVERFSPGAFNVGTERPGPAPAGARFFYLSIITLTTVGFGDPIHPFARSLVMIEAVMGQIYTTVLLAWLVSLEIAYRIRES
jgi:hypothetical protein